MANHDSSIKASQHPSYGMFTVLSILFAPIGFIVGIIYLTKSNKIEHKLGEHLVALSVLVLIVSTLLWLLFVPRQVITVTTPYGTSTVTPPVVAPIWDINAAYAQITDGMTKDQVATITQRTPTNCTETDMGSSGVFESCTYGDISSDHGIIIVSYHNGAETTKTKSSI